MARIYDPSDETDINDQCCRNCKWWNCDPVTDKRKCRSFSSEKNGRKTEGTEWCWCWQKDRGIKSKHAGSYR